MMTVLAAKLCQELRLVWQTLRPKYYIEAPKLLQNRSARHL